SNLGPAEARWEPRVPNSNEALREAVGPRAEVSNLWTGSKPDGSRPDRSTGAEPNDASCDAGSIGGQVAVSEPWVELRGFEPRTQTPPEPKRPEQRRLMSMRSGATSNPSRSANARASPGGRPR